MDDDTTPAEKATTDPESAASPLVDESTMADGSPLGSAIAALESLTAIVELLGSLGADRSDTRLAALAQQLRATAEQILERTGFGADEPTTEVEVQVEAEPAGDSANVTARAKSNVPAPTGPESSAVAADVAAAKRALTRLSELAAKGLLQATEKRAEPPAAAEVPAGITEGLAQLTESFRTLSSTVQEQQQRLGRVEKQFGLPNSSAHPERPARATEEVGWPLDLNHPMDRESVDKAVSFHDP